MATIKPEADWWAIDCDQLLLSLESRENGLSEEQVKSRLGRFGANAIIDSRSPSALALFIGQFRASLVLTLLAAAVIASLVGEYEEASIITSIVIISCVLSFLQEYRASRLMEDLRASLAIRAKVWREGQERDIPVSDIVPGDQVFISAGSLIPADGVVMVSNELTVSEASLTGEAFPVEKFKGQSPADAPLGKRTNALFCGTSVRSGYGRFLVTATAHQTVFAAIAHDLARERSESAFAAGIRNFGNMLTRIMLAIVIVIFAANLLLHRAVVDSLLFSVALGVGMTPELLPAVMSVTLARGARMLAGSGVMVRHLYAIENLGSINVLCTDKTGTLTAGTVALEKAVDISGAPSTTVARLAYCNALLQSGLKNPIDDAILNATKEQATASGVRKLGELPYDFNRKLLTIICAENKAGAMPEMISKGALKEVLAICSRIEIQGQLNPLTNQDRMQAESLLKNWSAEGFRVLGLATKQADVGKTYNRSDECDFVFRGYLIFFDEIKPGVTEVIDKLKARGITTRIVTGDNRYAAMHVARQVGLKADRVLTGKDIAHLTRPALEARVARTDVFAELDPAQKERVILALRKRGNVVGYLGDGINDAPALRAADVGMSVESAVDVARDAADFVLLEKDLVILLKGVEDGRKIFANTIKYITITMSANFGNMISMAVASLFLPFLPMLAKQILVNNLLSDLPALAIAGDNVDEEDIAAPHRWSVKTVEQFMIMFGLISSVFDGLSFLFLIHVLNVGEATFQTSWFLLSLVSEVGIVLVLRTRNAALKSRPSALLVTISLAVLVAALFFVTPPISASLGFVSIDWQAWTGVMSIVLAYLVLSEIVKSPLRHWMQRAARREH